MAAGNDMMTQGRIVLAAIGGGFLLAALTSVFLVKLLVDSEHRETMTSYRAAAIQEQLDLKISFVENHLTTIANTVHMAEVVSNQDLAARAAEETTLIDLIPHAIRVRIFAPGTAEIEREAIPPFSYTSLDLVNRVESGEQVSPEAINAGGRWILSVATPIAIPGDSRIRGTLFVYLDIAAITEDIDVPGALTLIQQVGTAKAVEVQTLGSATGGVATTMPLSNPNWTISYTPAGSDISGVGNIVLYLIPAILFVVVAGGGAFVGLRKMGVTLSRDISHLGHQIASVAGGSYKPSNTYAFREFIAVDQDLSRLGVGEQLADTLAPEVPKLKVKAIPQPEALVEDELVDIEMLDDEFGEVAEEAGDGEPEIMELDDLGELEEEGDDTASIFRAYDIRGVVNDTLTPEIIHSIGLAIGTEAGEIDEQTIVVGADGRVSSPEVMEALIGGLRASGRDVVSIGQVPTPVLYYATHNSDTQSGVMVTGSHNPPDYNGFKIVLGGETLAGEEIQKLYQRIQDSDFSEGNGTFSEIDITQDYIDAIADDVVIAQPLKVVLDCGNGIGGDVAPELILSLGCDVVPLYCDVDGTFPNHAPDPTVLSNLSDLISTVKSEGADIGIALDGDADRVVAVSASGDIIMPDRLLMLFVKDVVSRNPGSDIVYDIKCSRHLNSVISGFGGRPVMSRSGHSYVKKKMAETSAILGGEMSGHVCFSERWFGFDDGIYSAARLLEIVGAQTDSLDELMSEFPTSVSTPEVFVPVEERSKFALVQQIIDASDFGDATVTTIDGLRVDFADGWGLVRASNTNPQLTLRFEADDDAALARIQGLFREHLQNVDATLDF